MTYRQGFRSTYRPTILRAYRQEGGGSAPETEVTPLTIFGSKVVAWYRPDTGHVSVDGSNNVTQLDDRSGNAHHLNVVSGTPHLTTNGGNPCIDFEAGDTDALGRAAAILTNEPMAFYVVGTLESATAERSLFAISTGTASNNYFRLRVNTTPAAVMRVRDGSVNQDATHATTLSTATRYVFYGAATADDARAVNVGAGTEATDVDSITVGTPNYTTLGGFRTSSVFANTHDGLIFESVVLNAAPSAGEHTAYLAYTTSRFGTP